MWCFLHPLIKKLDLGEAKDTLKPPNTLSCLAYLIACVDCWERALEATYFFTANIGLEAGAST
jgi:hypothetical protein